MQNILKKSNQMLLITLIIFKKNSTFLTIGKVILIVHFFHQNMFESMLN